MASRRRTGSRYEFPDKDRSSLARRFRQMNRPPENTSWCWLTAEMLESSAWRALTGNAMKIILRIALEHLRHGGVENGKLPVTYSDFVRCGVRRNSVREAQLVAINLGFVDRTSIGEVPWHGDIHRPSTFGLTWLPRSDGVPPSNRWASIKTHSDAKAAVRSAKAELAQLRGLRSFFNRQVAQGPTPKDVTGAGDESDTSSSNDQVRGECNGPASSGSDSDTPFYISGYPESDAHPAISKSAGANDEGADARGTRPARRGSGRTATSDRCTGEPTSRPGPSK